MKYEYEAIIIVRPDIAEDEVRSVVRHYAEYFRENGVKRTGFEEWGRKKLAYPIQKFREGYYFDFHFICKDLFIDELVRKFNTDDNVIKHCVVKIGDDEWEDDEEFEDDDELPYEHACRESAKPDSASQVVQPEPDAMDVLLGFAHYAKTPSSSK